MEKINQYEYPTYSSTPEYYSEQDFKEVQEALLKNEATTTKVVLYLPPENIDIIIEEIK